MTTLLLASLLLNFLLSTVTLPSPAEAGNGKWQLLQQSIGIVAMHMQLLNNDRVVIYDRTDFGFSNLTLPHGRCRHDPHEKAVKKDCTAHSVEYDVASNTYRALFVQTDVWCSSGSAGPNGSLIQTGGFGDGDHKVRTFNPCPTCDWDEIDGALAVTRWYATNHKLPDGRQIIIGGTRQFNYEFYPKTSPAESTYGLPFLSETTDPRIENNLYPFVFLNVDGNLFIFANNRSILFNYQNNSVVRTYPDIPGGDPRCYPSTGSAVLLPLRNLEATYVEAEVLICGGAPRGSFWQAKYRNRFVEGLNTCARMKINDPKPEWVMETMPGPRVLNDMLLLPNGNVLIINGGSVGVAGWEIGRNPVLEPYLYKPNSPNGSRFEVQNSTDIPRMYHSTAVLLRDGRVLVGGGNPHQFYVFWNVLYPTELRLEAFSPPYLDPQFVPLRPIIMEPASLTNLSYGQNFNLRFQVNETLVPELVSVTMLSPPFNTHSFSMNQRMLVLTTKKVVMRGNSSYEYEVKAPGSSVLAPPGFYLIFVVHQEIPSEGIWVRMQ